MARFALFCLLSAMLPVTLASTNSYTANRHALDRFFDSFEQRSGPVRVLSFGDSMADSYRSIALQIVKRMLEKRPFAGISFNNVFNRSLSALTGGASIAPPSALWFSYQFQVPPTASVRWYNEQNSNGILADRLAFYWIAQPLGGQFELLASEKGQAPTRLALLDGFSASPKGCATNFAVPLSEYHIEVRTLAGTNYVLGPELVNTQTNGLHVAWLSYGGISLQQVEAVPRAVRDPILRAYAPDLLVWHFKEGVTNGLPAVLAENEEWFREAAPQMDVLYIGTPFSEGNDGGVRTIAENEVIRSFATTQNRAFVDCMTPGISYDWLLGQGLMDDPVHHNLQGGIFLGNAAWNDLGFYALGTNRRFNVRRNSAALLLEATLAPQLIYRFESSADLLQWTEFASRTNEPGEFGFSIRSGDPETFYRMLILPPP